MYPLAILKFCREELVQRESTDQWQGWFWEIRRKVLDYWIARLERGSEPAVGAAALSPDERRAILRENPLLAPRGVGVSAATGLDRDWQAEQRRRVAAYIAALKARR